MKLLLKILLPLVVLAVGAGAAMKLVNSREIPEPEARPVALPVVSTVEASRPAWRVEVPARGTVVPRRESHQVVEVAGRVTKVAPQLRDKQ